ncbi:MAG TPA: hypothetical protein PKC28_09900 [Bdellovibrionales bacterium]|nr:hypothetical protein [Bdellovibrionales bacterium]
MTKNVFVQFWKDWGQSDKNELIAKPNHLFTKAETSAKVGNEVSSNEHFESPVLMALSKEKILRADDSDCAPSNTNQHTDGSVSSFTIDADVCFSTRTPYHREGEGLITIRLWTFVQEKFYVLLSKADPTKYLVMTREENHNARNTNKYFWHIVGNGVVDSKNGVVKLQFDLFDTPIFMSLHPDRKPALTLANSKEAS